MTPSATSGRRRAAALALGAFVVFGALVGPIGPVAARPWAPRQEDPTHDDTSGDLQEEWDEVLGQEVEVFKELSKAQQERRAAADKLAGLTKQTRDKQIQLLEATQQLKSAEAELATRIRERKAAEKKAAAARERLRKQIVAAYVTGGEPGGTAEAFLKAHNGEEVGQALAFGRAVSGSTERLVDELEAAEAQRAKAAKAARQAKDDTVALRDQLAEDAEFLVEARGRQQLLLADINRTVLAEAQALRAVQGKKAVIEGRIVSLNRASDGVAGILNAIQADQPDWLPGSVLITTPLPGVEVSSPFGMRHHPILGIDRLHAGCDLGAPSGAEMHAAADGIVVLAEQRGGYGNTVVIDHGNSLATLYGHSSKLLVTAGQEVKRGDVIALVGSTGLSTGPHLHFETRLKGLPVDPEGVLDFAAPVDYDGNGKPDPD